MHEFRSWLRDRGDAPPTVRNYVNYATRAHHALGTLRGQDTETLTRWTRTLTDGCARGARKALISWYDFARTKTNPAQGITVKPEPKGKPRPMTPEQRARFVVAASELGGIHHAAGFLFGFTGARFSAVRHAHWRSFALTDDDPTWTVTGKGANRSGPRLYTIPLHPAVLRTMRSWRADSRGPAVFPGAAAGGVIGERALRDIHTEICERAGVAGIVPHRHRHTVGTMLYDLKGDIVAVQELLGHECLDTTRIYTRASARRIREAIEALPLPPGMAAR